MCAESVAVGSSAQHLRALLKSLSEKTWNYAAWLTHARAAGRSDAQIALSAVSQTIEAFIVAEKRQRLGAPRRCLVCASYQLRTDYDVDGGWVKVRETCAWQAPTEPATPTVYHDPVEDDEAAEADGQSASTSVLQGECVEPNLGIYLSPDQARSILDQASNRTDADGIQGGANPFAFFFPEDASLADAHRIAYTAFQHAPVAGAELAYACGDTACVNPAHAGEVVLPGEQRWMCGVVEKVTFRPAHLELHISLPGNGSRRVFVDHAMLDRYGFGDASSLAERVVFFTHPDDHGWVDLLPVQRRVDYEHGSTAAGWLHPVRAVADDQSCPCGSAERYSACHGGTNRFRSPLASHRPGLSGPPYRNAKRRVPDTGPQDGQYVPQPVQAKRRGIRLIAECHQP